VPGQRCNVRQRFAYRNRNTRALEFVFKVTVNRGYGVACDSAPNTLLSGIGIAIFIRRIWFHLPLLISPAVLPALRVLLGFARPSKHRDSSTEARLDRRGAHEHRRQST
jgi:hypothetical protein